MSSDGTASRIRIDKWLWHARFYRSRGLAQAAAASGVMRLNGARVEKPALSVKPGDVLTLPWRRNIVAVRILALSERRGPARHAEALYQILYESPLDPGPPPP